MHNITCYSKSIDPASEIIYSRMLKASQITSSILDLYSRFTSRMSCKICIRQSVHVSKERTYPRPPLLEGRLLLEQGLLLPQQLRPLLQDRSVVLDRRRQRLLLHLDLVLRAKDAFKTQQFPSDLGNLSHSFRVIKMLIAQRGARTHDPEIKSLMLYRLS